MKYITVQMFRNLYVGSSVFNAVFNVKCISTTKYSNFVGCLSVILMNHILEVILPPLAP